jgi:hypothetical protein
MEPSLIQANDIAPLVYLIASLGGAVVGFALGWLAKNWQANKVIEELEDLL